ncbi:DeoR/GlpR family DNA-binding transcription regulator [Paenibacillus aceti]|uniref:DeoR/GlpR family DNA-binding transcription regulator n=1 Tax=Paenibacillus aceti TaxID=1820010 RepID=UPI000EA16426|nr:DeoR/GlpR family DNA-binding transcription regulator [Paenibacillus aceti]
MLPIARKAKIKELIIEKKNVTVAELTAMFNVTEESIRRDLKQLEDEGILIRIYGGAYISDGVQNDVNVNLREHIHVEGKKRIASKCVEFIKNGDSIFLDASTTSLYIANMIGNKRITVVTNSMKIVNTLVDSPSVHLVIIGGVVSNSSMSALGRNAEQNMNSYYFDLAFISCRTISMQHGITDSNEQQAEVRRLAVERANTVYLVADHTKFDRTSFASICGFEHIHSIIVDKPLSQEWHEFLEAHNVALTECDE